MDKVTEELEKYVSDCLSNVRDNIDFIDALEKIQEKVEFLLDCAVHGH